MLRKIACIVFIGLYFLPIEASEKTHIPKKKIIYQKRSETVLPADPCTVNTERAQKLQKYLAHIALQDVRMMPRFHRPTHEMLEYIKMIRDRPRYHTEKNLKRMEKLGYYSQDFFQLSAKEAQELIPQPNSAQFTYADPDKLLNETLAAVHLANLIFILHKPKTPEPMIKRNFSLELSLKKTPAFCFIKRSRSIANTSQVTLPTQAESAAQTETAALPAFQPHSLALISRPPVEPQPLIPQTPHTASRRLASRNLAKSDQ